MKNLQWRNSRRKYNIHGNIEELLEKKYELGELVKFHKETGLFEDI